MLDRRRRNVVFVTIMLGMLLAALDQTIVGTALPTIVSDLGGAEHMSWVVTSYLLAETVATVLVGKFGDLFGRAELRAAVDAIAKRLLVEDLSHGLPQHVRPAGAEDRPRSSPRSPGARTGVG